MKVKVALILCDPMKHTVQGILQARILEWVTFPSPGDLSNPGIKSVFSALQADSLPFEPAEKPLSGKIIRLNPTMRIWNP